VLPETGDRVAAERRPHPLRSAAAPDVLPARRPAPAPRTVPVQTPHVLPPSPPQTRPVPAAAPPGAAVRLPPRAIAPAAAGPEMPPVLPSPEARGCLYALSQPPLMLFLLVIGGLLGLGAGYDLIFL
jgi:hypothetical protein